MKHNLEYISSEGLIQKFGREKVLSIVYGNDDCKYYICNKCGFIIFKEKDDGSSTCSLLNGFHDDEMILSCDEVIIKTIIE